MNTRMLLRGLGLAVLFFANAAAAAAQDYRLPATPLKGVWVEASYADLDGISQSFPSTMWFLSGRAPVWGALRVTADLPVAYSRMRIAGGPRASSTVVGNPYLGIEYGVSDLTLGAGLRLPLNSIDDESVADVVAFMGDLQRGEAFLDDVLPVSASASYTYRLPQGASVRAMGGVVGLLETGDSNEGNEALVDYGLLGTYPIGAARLGLGWYGRWAATEDEGSFGDNSVHHVALSGDFRVRGVRPGLSLLLPVDSTYGDVLNATVGVYVQVPLR